MAKLIPIKKNKFLSRRSFLIAFFLSLSFLKSKHLWAKCSKTPNQVEGPFYKSKGFSNNSDLTKYKNKLASGQIIEISGKILDEQCKPIKDCEISIWQANSFGKYNHPDDRSKSLLDPNFNGYSYFKNNKNGEYKFTTIKPGSYTAMNNWIRPPHIHIKIKKNQKTLLVTQLYFYGEPLNNKDLIFSSEKANMNLEVKMIKSNKNNILYGIFDFII